MGDDDPMDDPSFDTLAVHAGAGARRADRRGRAADLPDEHVRPGGRRPADPRLRVRPHPEPDPRAARAGRRGARGRHATGSPSPAARRPPPPSPSSSLPGEEVIAGDDVYGGTWRYLERVAGPRGVVARWRRPGGRPGRRLSGRASTERTRLVWFETPSNPHLKVIDIAAAVAAVAAAPRGARRAAARRRRQHVRDAGRSSARSTLGADVVFHSATKYLAGHSDTVLGVAGHRRDDLAERLRFLQNAMGAVPGPFDCFLVLRGLRTLALRIERHAANAAAVAGFLAGRDDVAWVSYPGLADGPHAHPQAALAARQMRRFGGMVSFAPAAGGRHGRDARARAIAICEAHPDLHAGRVARRRRVADRGAGDHDPRLGCRERLEVDDALIRLSVGIEAAERPRRGPRACPRRGLTASLDLTECAEPTSDSGRQEGMGTEMTEEPPSRPKAKRHRPRPLPTGVELRDQLFSRPMAERTAMGVALRERCRRRDLAPWELRRRSPRPDRPVDRVEQGPRRGPVPIRYGRMLATAVHVLPRRGAPIMASDLSRSPSPGLRVWACGDAHLLNFGAFATPERKMAFDINDFDETAIAPFDWDVKRLVASFVVAGRANGFAASDVRAAALTRRGLSRADGRVREEARARRLVLLDSTRSSCTRRPRPSSTSSRLKRLQVARGTERPCPRVREARLPGRRSAADQGRSAAALPPARVR